MNRHLLSRIALVTLCVLLFTLGLALTPLGSAKPPCWARHGTCPPTTTTTASSSSTSTASTTTTSTATSTTTASTTTTTTTTTTTPPASGLGLPRYGTANGSRYPFRSAADQDFEVAQEVALHSKLMRVDCAPGGNTVAVNKIVAAGVQPVCLIASTASWDYPTSHTAGELGSICSSEASALKGRARVFETINEPDLRGWAGHGAQWAPYQRACYQAIKAVQPNAVVLFPGMFEGPSGNTVLVDFVRDYYAAGGRAYMDAMNVHLYGDPAVCGGTRSIWAQTFGCAGGIYASYNVRSVMNANGDAGKAIVCTECGARVSSAADEPWQRDIVTRVLQAADGVGTGNRKLAFTLIYDVIDDEVVGYGMLRPDRSRRPSFSAFQAVAASQ